MRTSGRTGAILALLTVLAFGCGTAGATCTDFLVFFPIFQCADLAYFDAPPFTVTLDPNGKPTNVTAVFWQLGYGNGTLDDGSGTYGAGIGAGGAFNGNDSGVFPVELKDAGTATGGIITTSGATCLSNNNWGNARVDGCCDNPRDASLPFTKDDVLNPLYDVEIARTSGIPPTYVPSNDWVQDSPMAVLLRDTAGGYFAVAAVSAVARVTTRYEGLGWYAFKDVNDGLANPLTGAHNVVPWQSVPGKKGPSNPLGFVRDITSGSPSPTSNWIVTLGWNGATVYSDNGSRPSTNATVVGGMGTAEAGPLVRYVVETQSILDGVDVYGSLNPNGWSAAGTFMNPVTSAVITIPRDTCVRLHTYFGKAPATGTHNVASCRLGLCGDLGYDVVSPPSCLGGPLVSESPIELTAIRGRAGAVTLTWKAPIELTTTAYRIVAITKKGEAILGTVEAAGTGGGTPASYRFAVTPTQLKGTRTIEVVALPSGARARAPVQ